MLPRQHLTMSDMQLYFAGELFVFACLVNIALGVIQTSAIHAGITRLEATLNARFTGLESTMMPVSTVSIAPSAT